jgi:gas vesicle protein
MTAQRRLQNLRKIDYITPFLAGVGIGVAVSVLLAPEAGGKTRSRIRDITSRAGDVLKERAENLGDVAGDILAESKLTWRDQKERIQTMSDLKDKAKEKIDYAADAAKKATDQVVDKAKDVAHSAGKKMEEGGKRLQDA